MSTSPNQPTTCLSDSTSLRIAAVPRPTPPVVYGIDAKDRIVGASRSWDRFAVANDAPEVEFSSILGRSLWNFVSDDTTRAIYCDVIARVRDGATITLPLRCDAPALRRWLTLTASPLPRDGVKFTSRTIRQQARSHMAMLDVRTPRSKELLRSCGWCGKLNVAGMGWLEIEQAVQRMNLFEHPVLPRLTHGICPVCADAMLKLESDDLQSQLAAMA